MHFYTLIGFIIVGLSLAFIAFIVFWSSVIIKKIEAKKNRSLRQILKERRGGR